MPKIPEDQPCWECTHAYSLHRRYDSGSDCIRCPCSGFVRADHPWRLRALLWLDRQWTRRR
ncbi:hypothetical protein FHN55_14655 [Streptomyces sp. NP160]|uniref:hypothetical protein n=1 Tax=Streptomyces sp. NP160 TaxID=2586637 RepID=UPI00111B4C7A|nr:hypothetical protein [Streptomyces sp. NP160]TNM64218.1 hypothetical protein FHN55_14655 [Streptomyces sp. NP160]